MKLARSVVCGGVLLCLAACANPEREKETHLLYSPNGEPLNGGPLGKAACPDAVSRWFDAVAKGGKTIDQAAFMADADRQFRRMDLNKDGELVSSELEKYRAPYRQGLDPVPGIVDKRDRRLNEHRAIPTAAPDPVLSADVNNDFKVTQAEYNAQAERVFKELDKGHTGVLTRDDTLRLCNKK